MKRKCDHCNRPATHHSVEIVAGDKIEKHLCDLHAAAEGVSMKPAHTPLPDLLTNFVKQHASGATPSQGGAAAASAPSEQLACERCGTTFAQFREQSLLGCPQCYKDFEPQLSPLLERAHEGGSHHVGKVPRRAGVGEARQAQLMRLRQRLEDAVTGEDYELAARLRDDIRQLEVDE